MSNNIDTIKKATIILWLIAFILLIGVLLDNNSNNSDKAVRGEESDSSGWKAIEPQEENKNKPTATTITRKNSERLINSAKDINGGMFAVKNKVGQGLIGIAEIDFLVDEGFNERVGERCVVAVLTVPSYVVPKPKPPFHLVPSYSASVIAQLPPSLPMEPVPAPKPPSVLPPSQPEPSSPPPSPSTPEPPEPIGPTEPTNPSSPSNPLPPPKPPINNSRPDWMPGWLWDIAREFDDIDKDWNSAKDVARNLIDFYFQTPYINVSSEDSPRLLMTERSGKLCTPRLFPTRTEFPHRIEYKKGGEGMGYVGPLETNPNLTSMLLRMCGNNIPPHLKSLFQGDNPNPKPGPATMYTFKGGINSELGLSEIEIVEIKGTIRQDGSFLPEIANEDIEAAKRLAELERRYNNNDPAVRMGNILEESGLLERKSGPLTSRQKEELITLRRYFARKYSMLSGAPIFQNGKKVGTFTGIDRKQFFKGIITPISDIVSGYVEMTQRKVPVEE